MDITIIKECPKHGMVEHRLQINGSYRCKECLKDAVYDIRRRNKIKLVEYKGGKCEICGYNKCIDALEFHHLNQNEKEFGISCGDTKSLEKLKREADKCIMVCANCHREIHAKEKNKQYLKKEEEKIKNEYLFSEKNKGSISERKINIKKLYEKDKIEDVLQKVKNKIPKKDIANFYNVSVKSIKNLLRKNNIVYNESSSKNLNETINIFDFINLFKEYKTFTKVAKHYNVSVTSIKRWCRRNNIPYRKNEIIKFVENYTDISNCN